MKRRDFLVAAAAAPLLRAQTKRPNIVVLFTDDQRFDTIGALGHPEVRTPNMDRLVRRGVTFTHACTQGGLHGAICQPSRAQLMTGRSVFRVFRELIVKERNPNPAYVTFPEQMRKPVIRLSPPVSGTTDPPSSTAVSRRRKHLLRRHG